MNFPGLSKLFAKAIHERDVLLFQSSREIGTPHFYICIKKTDNEVILLVISTTQEDRLKRHIANNGLNSNTIVNIKSHSEDPNSPMKQNSWINCNDVYQYTVDEIADLHRQGKLKSINTLPTEYYEQIINGICLSNKVDKEIQDLFNNNK